MPDRYGDRDDDDDVIIDQTIVDFESRRLDRESIAAQQRQAERSKRLAETRSTHASLGTDQAAAIKRHRQQVTTTADERRRVQWIANCTLCDDDGYRPGSATLCDHIDRSASHARGMALVRATMGWDDPAGPPPEPTPLPQQAPAAPQPLSGPDEPNTYPDWDARAWGYTEPPDPEDW